MTTSPSPPSPSTKEKITHFIFSKELDFENRVPSGRDLTIALAVLPLSTRALFLEWTGAIEDETNGIIHSASNAFYRKFAESVVDELSSLPGLGPAKARSAVVAERQYDPCTPMKTHYYTLAEGVASYNRFVLELKHNPERLLERPQPGHLFRASRKMNIEAIGRAYRSTLFSRKDIVTLREWLTDLETKGFCNE